MIPQSPRFTVGELVPLLGGELRAGSPETAILGVASLAEAGEGEVAFFGNPKYLAALRRSRASAVLVPREFPGDGGLPCAVVAVDNPALAFAGLVERFAPPPPVDMPGVAPTALLGRDVILGAHVSVGPYAVIEDGVVLGDGVVIGAHVFIGAGTTIGDGSRIYPLVTIRERCRIGRRAIIHGGVVIGSDGFGFEPQEGRHVKVPQTGIVQIDDDVEIGANTTVDRARFGRTHIGEGTKIDNLVQIAHNVVIGPHGIVCAQAGISGSTRLGHHVIVAGQVGIVGHVEIGDEAVLAVNVGAGVSKSVPAKAVMWGYPAEPLSEVKEGLAPRAPPAQADGTCQEAGSRDRGAQGGDAGRNRGVDRFSPGCGRDRGCGRTPPGRPAAPRDGIAAGAGGCSAWGRRASWRGKPG